MIEPYDMYLKTMPAVHRARWGRTVVSQLATAFGPVVGMTVEIHASADYVVPITSLLSSQGARVVTPLAGLTVGSCLARYEGGVAGDEVEHDDARAAAPQVTASTPEWSGAVERLGESTRRCPPRTLSPLVGRGCATPVCTAGGSIP